MTLLSTFLQSSLPIEKRRNANITKFKNLKIQTEEDPSLIGYEPVLLFLEELQRLYTSSVVFFHDPLTSLVIGGLWNPHTQSRTLKINLPYGTRPVSSDSGDHYDPVVEIDRLAILSEIARLGGDIVARIEVR